MPECYEIKIIGHLDQSRLNWFAGLKLTHLEGNETLLSGSFANRVALYGLLERICDLNQAWISVVRREPSSQLTVQEVKP